MQPAVSGHAGLAAEAVEDLHEVAVLQRPALTIGEEERLGRGVRVTGERRLQRPRGGRPDESNTVFATLAAPDEQVPIPPGANPLRAGAAVHWRGALNRPA